MIHVGIAGIKPEICGVGTVAPPAFTPDCLSAIRQRADQVTDNQLKTDLFRLICEVERLQGIHHGQG